MHKLKRYEIDVISEDSHLFESKLTFSLQNLKYMMILLHFGKILNFCSQNVVGNVENFIVNLGTIWDPSSPFLSFIFLKFILNHTSSQYNNFTKTKKKIVLFNHTFFKKVGSNKPLVFTSIIPSVTI